MPLLCTWCHIAVPHGWKNKALLVNLNDIGPEVMCRQVDIDVYGIVCTKGLEIPAGSSVTKGVSRNNGYDNPPYYINARLMLTRFNASGNWAEDDCGGKELMKSLCAKGSGYE